MRRISLCLRLVVGLGLALPLGLVLAPLAGATWTSSGSGAAGSVAYTMPSGSQPSVSASGSSVSLRWAAALFPDNLGVAGYVIKRYDANGTAVTVGASCGGVVTTTTCTELDVPPGTWIYTDTPVQDDWAGGESPGTPVTVS
jgi:hypothetical protein